MSAADVSESAAPVSALFAEVAVALPVYSTFHYRVPPEWAGQVLVGQEVVVPFGRRRLRGYIVSLAGQPPAGLENSLRDILEVTSLEPFFHEQQLSFYRWLSSYYLAPLGEVIQGSLPRGVRGSRRRSLQVTDRGSRALEEGETSAEESALLRLLQQHPGMSMGNLERSLPGSGPLCRRLKNRGLLIWEDHLLCPPVKARRLKVVRRAAAADLYLPEEGLKPREEEILAFLVSGPMLLRDLERQVGNASYWVEKLAERGLVEVNFEEVYRDPTGPAVIEPGPPPALSEEQEEAVRKVLEALRNSGYASFLLHGITGSGKTEVYLAAAAAALDLGRQSLILVSEIALSGQMEALFRQRFGSKVAVLHSGLGQGERRDEWMRVFRGDVEVVVGARSAIFAPLERLGLVVVDEEHDSSYKQESSLRYHARDAAVMRARLSEAVVLMGSATPSLPSYYNALHGKFRLLRITHRIDRRPLPEVAVVDMRREKEGALLSFPLRQALADTLAAGKQALLLINRRGYASFLLCRRCGHVPHCWNCALSLTWHRSEESLRCHLCGLAVPAPALCPQCEARAFKPFGFGTQRVEAEVQRLFPQARVSRMDRDTTRSKQAYPRILGDFSRGQTDVLIGTQMVAKGHDFPNVTLVGVVSADTSLRWPDYRAGEVTFQLLTQVAGRAGRGPDPGKVIIQTYDPGHYSIRFARQHDYSGFFKTEAAFRRELGYPPFRRLALLMLRGNVEEKTRRAAQRLAARYGELCSERPALKQEVELLGPVAAPLSRVKGKYHWQLLLRSKRPSCLGELGRQLVRWGQTALKGSGVSLSVDVDPLSLI